MLEWDLWCLISKNKKTNIASLQSNNRKYEDNKNNLIQAFMYEIEETQIKDECGVNHIEAYMVDHF